VNVYNRLFKYRVIDSQSPAENFLTEAFVDIFNRFPISVRKEFALGLLPSSCSFLLESVLKDPAEIEARTQVGIVLSSFVKRPDAIIYADDNPIIIIEFKVDAVIQEHRIPSNIGEESASPSGEMAIQNQLETYKQWIHSHRTQRWPGAVVFVTRSTPAPANFENDGKDRKSAIGVKRGWKALADWFMDNLDLRKKEVTYCALASEYRDFLQEGGLMSEFVSARDLAAASIYMSAHKNLEHTFRTVISEIGAKYRNLKGGNIHSEFWANGNSYLGWYYINGKLNPTGSRFYLGIGVCFPNTTALEEENPVGLPRHEPFFFVIIADDTRKKKVSALLEGELEGWAEIWDGSGRVAACAVSKFDADPDLRVQLLSKWAQDEVGRAVACIPNFAATPVAEVPEESE
jgi:hypothetical protein